MRRILSKTTTKRITTLITTFVLAVSSLSGVIAPLFASVAFAEPAPSPWCSTGTVYAFTKGGFSWSNPTGGQNGTNTTWSGSQGSSPVVVTTSGTGGSNTSWQKVPSTQSYNNVMVERTNIGHYTGPQNKTWHPGEWSNWQYEASQNNWQDIPAGANVSAGSIDNPIKIPGSGDGNWVQTQHGTATWTVTTYTWQWVNITPTQPSAPSANWNINVASGYDYLGLQTNYGYGDYSSSSPYPTAVPNQWNSNKLASIKVCAAPIQIQSAQLSAPTISCVDTVNIPNFTQTWSKVSGATGYAYTTTYNSGANTYSDSSSVHDGSIVYDLSGTNVTRTNNTGTPLATYVWKVKALGNGTTTSDSEWSAPCSTTYALPVVNHAPSVPVLVSPQTITYRHSGDNNYSTWNPSTDPDAGDTVTYRYQSSFSDTTNPDGSFQTVAYDTNNHGGNLTATQIQNGGPNGQEPEGIYYWHVEAVDNHGLASGWATPWEIVVDNTAPSVPTNGIPSGGVYLNSNVFNYTWDASTDNFGPVHYEYLFSNSPDVDENGMLANVVWSSEANANQAQHDAIYSGPSIPSVGTQDGTHYWQVRAVDAAGNKSAWSEVWNYTLDTVAPTVGVNTLSTSDTTPTITGTIDDPSATVTVRVNGVDYVAVNNGDGTWTADVTNAIATGVYNVIATATDLAGNVGVDTTTNELTIFELPPVPQQLLVGPTTTTLFLTPAPRPNGGNNGLGGGTTTNPNDEAVAGAQTQTPSNQGGNKDQAVEGASDTKGPWSLWGIAWYWWLIILAVLGAIIWWLIAGYRRRSDEA